MIGYGIYGSLYVQVLDEMSGELLINYGGPIWVKRSEVIAFQYLSDINNKVNLEFVQKGA